MGYTVIGAGMAGLLAAAMLRDEVDNVFEAQPGIPNNHSAVLRFRTTAVSDALNIPFKKVQVLKGVASYQNTIADALAYSHKTTGSFMLRSILSAKENVVERYIAPKDLISRMAKKVMAPIKFGQRFELASERALSDHTVSTIPMPELMRLLDYRKITHIPKFESRPGYNVLVDLGWNIDAYSSLYTPDPALAFARLSISGNELIIECYGEQKKSTEAIVESAMSELGISSFIVPKSFEVKEQKYAKILPIDDDERQRFMIWATDRYNIFSLGRFATWRPGLLLDDVVNDVRVIQRLAMKMGEAYKQIKKGAA